MRGPEIGCRYRAQAGGRNDLTGISRRYFTPSETADLARLEGEPHRERFFVYWTLKEAYIKARGEGIFIGLDNFGFQVEPGGEPAVTISFADPGFDTPGGWEFHTLQPWENYPISVALRDAPVAHSLAINDAAALFDWQ